MKKSVIAFISLLCSCSAMKKQQFVGVQYAQQIAKNGNIIITASSGTKTFPYTGSRKMFIEQFNEGDSIVQAKQEWIAVMHNRANLRAGAPWDIRVNGVVVYTKASNLSWWVESIYFIAPYDSPGDGKITFIAGSKNKKYIGIKIRSSYLGGEKSFLYEFLNNEWVNVPNPTDQQFNVCMYI